MEGMPGYSFFITEGVNTQEILLGVRSELTAFVTQKVEFSSRDTYMRPGALLTVRVDGVDYTLLFLHVASLQTPRGFGLRTDMIDRALAFRATLRKAARRTPNYLFLGDLNAMGLDYVMGKEEPPSRRLSRVQASGAQELARLRYFAGKNRMRVLSKTHDLTWRNGDLSSNLDHVVAAQHLRFTKFGDAEVAVRGWPEQATDDEQRKWTSRFSDHALLYFEVEKLQ
jgi:hypothetical protein